MHDRKYATNFYMHNQKTSNKLLNAWSKTQATNFKMHDQKTCNKLLHAWSENKQQTSKCVIKKQATNF